MQTSHLEAGGYRLLERVRDTGRRELWRAFDEWSNRPVLLAVDAERAWVVSEGFCAQTLLGVLRRSDVGSVDIVRWGRDVADGLAVAHGAGLVHRRGGRGV